MTRSCPVRNHTRSLPSRLTPEIRKTCRDVLAQLKAEQLQKQREADRIIERRITHQDFETALYEAALALDIAEFGESE